MSNFTWKEVKGIMNTTPTELVGKNLDNYDPAYKAYVGSYHKSNCNWGYPVIPTSPL